MWEYVALGDGADRIRAHPEIAGCAAVRSPGDRLYVLVEQQGLTYGAVLRDIVLDEVGAIHPDIAVAVVPEIPMTGAGDVDQAAATALAERFGTVDRWVFALEPPADEREKAVAELVLDVLQAKRISMTDSLPLLGADSLVLVELSAAITEQFGVTVNGMDLFNVDDIRELTALVFADDEDQPG